MAVISLGPKLWREYIRQVRSAAVSVRWSKADRKPAHTNRRKNDIQSLHLVRSAAGKKGNEARWGKKIDEAAAAAAREKLITDNLEWSRSVARKVYSQFTKAGQDGYHSHIEIEDLESWASVGLVQAANRYNEAEGCFQGFAYRRVRGAIFDAYRRRSYTELTHESVEGMVERLGFMPAGYVTDTAPLPDAVAIKNDEAARIDAAIAALPEEERAIIRELQAGAKVSSIASARGRSANWARKRVESAKQKLREAA
jgi:RNA polymerase sigma factor (sigma-70 family)